ncbi:MAG: hypothetical protein ACTSRK_05035 [Promethearchaeota archaeon]
MNIIRKIFEELKKRNVLTAILITDVISTILFFLNPFMIIISGDIDLFLGILVGLLYIIKKKEPDQNPLGTCMKTGIFGGLISSISLIVISIFNTPQDLYGINEIVLILVLTGQFLGVFLGFFFGILISFREKQE